MAGYAVLRAMAGYAGLAAALVAGGCGYRLGFERIPGVRTVAVPVFSNHTLPYQREVEVDLTRAVVREVQARTPYRVVPDPALADAVLVGEVMGYAQSPLVEGRRDEVLESSVTVTVRLTLLDRGRPVFEGRTVSDTARFSAALGQDLAAARREALEEIAERVVFEMEAAAGPW